MRLYQSSLAVVKAQARDSNMVLVTVGKGGNGRFL